jgi:hypothetical protein
MDAWMPLVRVLLGLVTAVGLAALILNTILTGRDVPAGLLTLLTSIVGAVFGLEAVNRRRGPPSD